MANETMKGYVLVERDRAELREVPAPRPSYGEAVLRVRTASICATDLKIIAGRLAAKPGTILGHEFVGEVVELGPGLSGYERGQRVLVHADTPCGMCYECLANPNGRGCHAEGSFGAFHLGLLRDGAHAEYVSVPYAQANLVPIPESVADEHAVLLADVGSTGFGSVEAANLRMGDVVVVVGQGPVGLCATAAARLRGAGLIIGVDVVPWRLKMARRMGADIVLDGSQVDVVEEVRRLTDGWLADVAIEAVGMPDTFLTALRLTRPAGVLSSVGNYGMQGTLELPLALDAFMGGVGDKTITTTASPGGKDRGRRLLSLLATGKVDLSPLITHRYALDEIDRAYDVFRARDEEIFKVAVIP